jgi:hypothetical protein
MTPDSTAIPQDDILTASFKRVLKLPPNMPTAEVVRRANRAIVAAQRHAARQDVIAARKKAEAKAARRKPRDRQSKAPKTAKSISRRSAPTVRVAETPPDDPDPDPLTPERMSQVRAIVFAYLHRHPAPVEREDAAQEVLLALVRRRGMRSGYDSARATFTTFIWWLTRSTVGHMLELRSRRWASPGCVSSKMEAAHERRLAKLAVGAWTAAAEGSGR